ncbi:MAG: CYTH domain-containing protein [bacterium]|nr:CYTH domain-containing protein [bacterium]
MIEVEKKLKITPEQEKNLVTGAEFIKEERLLNSYYDNSEYSLTKKDLWLRDRNGRFELKVPIAVKHTGQYEELENDDDIKKTLSFPETAELRQELAKRGYLPFYSCLTIRRKYKKEGLTIDLDLTYFDEKTIYEIAEIELLVKTKEDAPVAISQIKEFAAKNGIPYDKAHGKIIEFLKRYRPDHYQILIDAGVIMGF